MELKITIMTWEEFKLAFSYPYKIIYGILNVFKEIEITPGITLIDLAVFSIITLIIATFIFLQTRKG